MRSVSLQVKIDESLKVAAAKAAQQQGFSSLQEVVRVFLTHLARYPVMVDFSFDEPDEILTKEQDEALVRQYNKVKKEVEGGEGFVAESAEEMIKHLRTV
jgi:antitoxin component of RelBE/YafQ-DinJ toxin-antitoxin module